MTMITVKSAKTGEQPAEQRYDSLDASILKKPSNLPYYFAMAVTTLLAYFKSASPAGTQAAPENSDLIEPQKLEPKPQRAIPQHEKEKNSSYQDEPYFWPDDEMLTLVEPRSNIIQFRQKISVDEDVISFRLKSVGNPSTEQDGDSSILPAAEIAANGSPASADTSPVPDQADDKKRNRAPEKSGSVRLNDLMAGQAVLIGLSELLGNAIDRDGDALTVTNVRVSSGSIGAAANGWVYSSNRQSEDGTVVVTYDISDGEDVIQQTATFNIAGRMPLVGTDGSDVLVGLGSGDTLIGLDGNDILTGRDGSDIIAGGPGNDRIAGGAGNDFIRAEAGDDVVFGGLGDDFISGGLGDDRLFGDEGNDTISGDEGIDLIEGGAGHDHLAGGDGDDAVRGNDGDDILLGGQGNDLLADGAGSDVVLGEEGDDRMSLELDGNSDFFDGGDGNDTLDISASVEAVQLDMAKQTASGSEIGDDRFAGIEMVVTGSGDDHLTDGDGTQDIAASDGNDTVAVALDRAADTFSGGSGEDLLDLSLTTDGVIVDLENSIASGDEIGSNNISGFENFIGGSGDDTFHVDAGIVDAALTFTGGSGDDRFEFELDAGSGHGSSQLVHQILDFLVGDELVVADYHFQRVMETDGHSRFEKVYAPELDDDEFIVRMRDVHTGEMQYAVVEVDRDKDNVFEFSVEVFETGFANNQGLPVLA